MAKPRVFISSTYYDLKHLRASLENFVDKLGYEPVLSEKGDIAYLPDKPLDVSCYKEVENADIFVLIIGGRYGSEATGDKKKFNHKFFEQYESITKKEYEEASRKDIPTYIFIESNVYAEYRTYLKNKTNEEIKYAHVDSVNIFSFIEEIILKPLNNPIQPFEKFSDIENWLKEQWAGLFKDLLRRLSSQEQLSDLSTKVEELGEINKTLKTYLESLMKNINPDTSNALIETEKRRLEDAKIREEFKNNYWYFLVNLEGLELDTFIEIVKKSNSFKDFAKRVADQKLLFVTKEYITAILNASLYYKTSFNKLRTVLGLSTFRSMDKE